MALQTPQTLDCTVIKVQTEQLKKHPRAAILTAPMQLIYSDTPLALCIGSGRELTLSKEKGKNQSGADTTVILSVAVDYTFLMCPREEVRKIVRSLSAGNPNMEIDVKSASKSIIPESLQAAYDSYIPWFEANYEKVYPKPKQNSLPVYR